MDKDSEQKYIHFLPHPPKIAIIILGTLFLAISLNYFLDSYKLYQSVKSEKKTITISAEGRLTATPDVASLNISIITNGKNVKKIEEENSKKVNLIIDFIKSLGVKKEDIKTANYNLNPQYYYPYDYPRIPCPLESEVISSQPFICPPKTQTIIGYELNQIISLKIRDFKIIGDLISESIIKGANQISDLRFYIDDPDQLKNEARKLALTSAKQKARDLAATAGVSLGKVVSFSEGQIYFPRQTFYQTEGISLKAERADMAPQIEAGSEEIQVTMNVIFEIK